MKTRPEPTLHNARIPRNRCPAAYKVASGADLHHPMPKSVRDKWRGDRPKKVLGRIWPFIVMLTALSFAGSFTGSIDIHVSTDANVAAERCDRGAAHQTQPAIDRSTF